MHKIKFLGFIFFNFIQIRRSVIEKMKKCQNNISKIFFVGIDHEKIKKQVKNTDLVNCKIKPKYVKLDHNLKPWKIIQKFYKKIKKFSNYYYYYLTYVNDLKMYYYYLRYSCLKILAYKMKISTNLVQKIYGEKLKMNIVGILKK